MRAQTDYTTENWRQVVEKVFGISALLSVSTSAVFAQEALRESIAGETAAEERRLAAENQIYNIKAGPVKLLFDASLAIGFSDNVNLADSARDPGRPTQPARQSDLVLQPQFKMRSYWPITQQNTLNVSIGAGYAKYVNHSEYDHPTILPDSALSFDVYVGDFRINLHERFYYVIDPLQYGEISGVADYGGLSNQAGFTVDWDLFKLLLSVGYDHLNFVASSSLFNYLNRSSELFSSRAALLANPTTKVGVEVTAGFTDYEKHFFHKNASYSFGFFGNSKLTENFEIIPRAGYVLYFFDAGDQGGQGAEQGAFYFSLDIKHQINEYVSQSIRGGREAQLGITADLFEHYYVQHELVWNVIRDVKVTTALFYEHGKTLGFRSGAKFDRFGAMTYFTYQLMEKLTARLGYTYMLKDSVLPFLDYYQNAANLDFTYHF